jgi:hypothetical protein
MNKHQLVIHQHEKRNKSPSMHKPPTDITFSPRPKRERSKSLKESPERSSKYINGIDEHPHNQETPKV